MSLRSALNLLNPRAPRPARASRTAPRRRPAYRPGLELLEGRLVPTAYLQTNLAADQAGVAQIHDPELIEAWGISINPSATGTFWVSARATDVSTVYTGDVTRADGTIGPLVKSALTVAIPGGAPTGQVFSGSTTDFFVSSGVNSGPARFIFATDAGEIIGWNATVPSPPAPSRISHLMATTDGAVYTGLAIGQRRHRELPLRRRFRQQQDRRLRPHLHGHDAGRRRLRGPGNFPTVTPPSTSGTSGACSTSRTPSRKTATSSPTAAAASSASSTPMGTS